MQKSINTHNLSEEIFHVIRNALVGCLGLIIFFTVILIICYWACFSYKEKTPIELEHNEPKIKQKVQTAHLNYKRKSRNALIDRK